MAYQVLVTDHLTEEMIAAGKVLTTLLDEAAFPVTASFWFYLSEMKLWRLVMASPVVDSLGPVEAYNQVEAVLSRMPEPKISNRDVTVVAPGDRLPSLLRKAIKADPKLEGVRFTQNVVNGVLIEDAYLYRTA